MDHEQSTEGLRSYNQAVLHDAYEVITAKMREQLDGQPSVKFLRQINSARIQLYSSDGNSEECYLSLRPVDLSTELPTVEVQLRLLDGNNDLQLGKLLFTRKSEESTGKAVDPVTAFYETQLVIESGDFKALGIGTSLITESEEVLVNLWKMSVPNSSVQRLRLLIEDASEPRKWSSRRAKELGYDRYGKNVAGLDQFKKDIPLVAQSPKGIFSFSKRNHS